MVTALQGSQLNIANGIREFALASPSAKAVVDGERVLTFAELDERASRLANALIGRGLQPGEHVAVLLRNRLEFCEVACGIAKAGCVSVPINPRLTLTEADYILGHSESRALIAERDLLAAAAVNREEMRTDAVLAVDGDYEDTLAAAPGHDPRVPVVETDPFTIAYTSGTTGRPKGVVISHRARSLTFYCAALEWGLGPGSITIAVAPMYHGAGFALGYAGCHSGGTVVMMRRWDPRELLALIAEHRVGSIFLVPAHVQMLRALGSNEIARHDLTSLTHVYTNAAPMPQELKVWLLDTLPWVSLYEMYGSTEAGIVTCLRPRDQLRKVRCVGPAWFLNEVRVLDDSGRAVATGEPGVLWSRSPSVFRGYFKDEQATAAATSVDGFVTAGDVAILDEDNCVYIVDRVSDMILTGGMNVFPSEIEIVLREHSKVAEVAVIGVPDETWGERIVAVVIAEPDVPTVTEDEILSHGRERLAGYKMPKEIRFADALPRNAAGKILRRELRAQMARTEADA